MGRGIEWDRGRVAWWALGLALAAAALYVLHRFIGTFVFGVFLYYATRPVYKRVRRRVDQPTVAAGLSLVLFLLPSFLLISYTLAITYAQARRFADRADELARSGGFEEYESLVQPYLEASELLTRPEELLAGGGVDVVGGLLVTSLTYLGTLAIFLLHVFVIVAVAFYLLRDDRSFSRWFGRRFADDRGVLAEYLAVVDKDFNNIFFGNILNAVITAVIGAIVYTVLNLLSPAGLSIPYAALVGLLAGTASLVPVVGMKLVYVPVAIYLFAVPLANGQPELMWFPVTFAAVSFVVVDTIPDLVLRPYVSGRSLHMGALMLAYVLGPLLFGWYGLFLAPMILVLVVHFARIVLPELVAGEPMKPYAVDPTYLAGEGVVDAAGSQGRASGEAAPGAAAPVGRPAGAPEGTGDQPADDALPADDEPGAGEAFATEDDRTGTPTPPLEDESPESG